MQQSPFKTIWCDQDIEGKEAQREFNTAIKQLARSRWAKSPDVKHFPAEKSNLIQLADMVAYALQRDIRGLPEKSEMREAVRKLRRKEGNRIWEVGEDDLRPYL